MYEATLRIASITKQDTETQFKLTAYNTIGRQEYYVQISTEPEPEGRCVRLYAYEEMYTWLV